MKYQINIKSFALFFICIVLLFTACDIQKKSRQIPDSFDTGSFEGNTYKNDFFKCSLSVPEGWIIDDSGNDDEVDEEAMTMMDIDSEKLEKLTEEGKGTSKTFFEAYSYDPDIEDDPQEPFCSVMLMVEKIGIQQKKIKERDYLDALKTHFGSIVSSSVKNEPYKEMKLGNSEFSRLRIRLPVQDSGEYVLQDYYVKIVRGYALCFIVTQVDGDESDRLNELFDSFEMD